jgi:hypothetical protein
MSAPPTDNEQYSKKVKRSPATTNRQQQRTVWQEITILGGRHSSALLLVVSERRFFLDRFLCSIRRPVSSPRLAVLQSRRAQGAGKVARRPTLRRTPRLPRACQATLDSFEHDGTAWRGRDDDPSGGGSLSALLTGRPSLRKANLPRDSPGIAHGFALRRTFLKNHTAIRSPEPQRPRPAPPSGEVGLFRRKRICGARTRKCSVASIRHNALRLSRHGRQSDVGSTHEPPVVPRSPTRFVSHQDC